MNLKRIFNEVLLYFNHSPTDSCENCGIDSVIRLCIAEDILFLLSTYRHVLVRLDSSSYLDHPHY